MSNTSTPIQLYANLLREVKRRVEVVDFMLFGGGHSLYRPTTTETICLQIRKILELIAFGSLVANKTLYAAAHKKFESDWNAKLLLARLEKINPNFYPYPVVDTPSQLIGEPAAFVPLPSGYLTKDDFIDVYGRCSGVIHAMNPYGIQTRYDLVEKAIPEWREKILKLLNCHQVRFVGHERFWLLQMRVEGDDEVHYSEFELVTGHG